MKETEEAKTKWDEEIERNNDPLKGPVLYNGDGRLNTRKTILMIDDDTFLLDMYGIKFVEAGFNSYALTTGNGDIVQKVLDVMPDLISLDIVMPGRFGFEVIEILKADKRTQNIPVIFLTNMSQASKINQGINLGAVDYIITANVTPAELIDTYSSYLNNPKLYKIWIDNPLNGYNFYK